MKSRFFVIILFSVISQIQFIQPVYGKDWSLANSYNSKADGYIKNKNYESAVKELQKAAAEWPDGGYYSARTGWVYLWLMNKPDRAKPFYEKALEEGGDKTPWILREIGFVYSRLKEFADAENYFNKSLELAKENLKNNQNPQNESGLKLEITTSMAGLAEVYNFQEKWESAYSLTKEGYDIDLDSNNFLLAKTRFSSAVWQGHIAFSEGNYSEAISFYSEAESAASKNPEIEKWVSTMDIKHHRELAEERSVLGKIKPVYEHKVLALFVKNVDTSFKGLNGSRVSAKNTMSELEEKRAVLFQKILIQMIEAASGGNYTVSFENKYIDSTIKDFNVSYSGTVETRIPVLETVTPSLETIYYENKNKYDSFAIYWNGEGIATSANGGGQVYPYLPYQVYSSVRGFISYPTNWKEEGNMVGVFHEFFHNIEAMSGIQPIHGFADGARNSFPHWKGSGQLDYYRWHFKNTLPKILNDKKLAEGKPDWRNLNWLKRNPDLWTEDDIQANRDAISSISIENRKKAFDLIREANDLFWSKGQKEKAGVLFKQAYTLNPYHPDVIRYMADQALQKKDYAEAESQFLLLVKLKPEIWVFRNLIWIQQWQLKNPSSAITSFESLFKRYPSEKKILVVEYGRALMETGQTNAALKAFEEGLSSEDKSLNPPTAIQASFWKGFILGEKMNKQGEAYTLVKNAVDGGFNNEFSRFYLKKYANAGKTVALRSALPELSVPTRPEAKKVKVVKPEVE